MLVPISPLHKPTITISTVLNPFTLSPIIGGGDLPASRAAAMDLPLLLFVVSLWLFDASIVGIAIAGRRL
jgi:hypothetical protein